MRLLIISQMPHHRRDGRIVGWGATVRELDQLATRFDNIRHVACLHEGPAPASAIPYSASNLELVPVRPSGAEGFTGKLDALRAMPSYISTISRELPAADMVHVRAPANIALLAMVMLSLRKQPAARWFKYAGNWKPDHRESPSYTFQRWWLSRKWHRGVVTVNGQWPHQPSWVRTFFNPSLDERDIENGCLAAARKSLSLPIRLLFVGRLESAKGADRCVQIIADLRQRGIEARLELVGDGPGASRFRAMADELGVADVCDFLGWQSPSQVRAAYERAHVLLLPTYASEGWPKVLSEGMAYGVVPLAGAVSSIPQYLSQLQTGAALPPEDTASFADAIADYVRSPQTWAAQSERAVEATRWFSFSHYLESIDSLLDDLDLPSVTA